MQPIYRASQYRNTAVHQPGRAPQTNIPTPDFSQQAKASAAMVDHADQLQNTIIEEIEYSSSLAEEQRIFDLTNNTLAEYQRRDNLPDGDPESWYDEDGIFRQADFDAWESEQLYQLTTTPTAGFIRPESKRKAQANALDTRNRLHEQLTANLGKSIPQHARRKFATTYENHMKKMDFQGAIKVVSSAPSSVLTDEEKIDLLDEINQSEILYSVESAAVSGDYENFLNVYYSKIKDADNATKLKLQKMLKNVAPPAPRAGVKRKADGSVEYKKEFPHMITGVPDYVYDFYTKSGGQPAFKADANLRNQALSVLTKFAAESIQSDDPAGIERFKIVANLMSLDEGAANAILEPVLEDLKGAAPYNPRETSEKLITWRSYATPEQSALIANYENDINELLSLRRRISAGEEIIPDGAEDPLTLEQVNASYSAVNASYSLLANELKEKEKAAEVNAYRDFLLWKGRNKNASKSEQLTAYWDCADKYSPAKLKELPEYQTELSSILEHSKGVALTIMERKEAFEKYKANVEATDKRRLEEAKETVGEASAPPVSTASYTCSTDDVAAASLPESHSEAILYLPLDSPEPRTGIQVRNGDISYYAKVVKTDKVTTAQLSNMLRLRLDVLGQHDYNTIVVGAEDARLIRTPKATSMADDIVMHEARRDKEGNLIVYSLSAADGGGSFEVAGINEKHHPKDAAKLKKMIEDKVPNSEVEQAAKDYIIHFTQPAADTVTLAGVKSEAIEFLMRDIYFNMGQGGMEEILFAATGTESQKAALSALHDTVVNRGEEEVLRLITKARINRYNNIIAHNNKKAVFHKGWMNRSRSALTAALRYIK